MAAKKSSGEVVNLTVSILRNIRDELRELNGRIGGVEQRLGTLESTAGRGFEAVTARLENICDFSGERWRELEKRVRKLENRLVSR